LLIISFLAFCTLLFSAEDAGAGTGSRLGLETGYRADQFRWNINGDYSDPGWILSELTWKNLRIHTTRGRLRLPLRRSLLLRASLEYGRILDGEVQDSDYLGNNRTLEFSRSNNAADHGYMLDLSAGVGYILRSRNERIELIPFAGYARHSQNLTLTDGNQTIPATGSFSGLNSTYNAEWTGPTAGFDIVVHGERLVVTTSFEFLFFADYYAEADWNLRSDFQHPVSYTHRADNARGIDFSFALDYPLSLRWLISGTVKLSQFTASNGTDTTYLATGSTSRTRLNEVVWDSYSATFGLKYLF